MSRKANSYRSAASVAVLELLDLERLRDLGMDGWMHSTDGVILSMGTHSGRRHKVRVTQDAHGFYVVCAFCTFGMTVHVLSDQGAVAEDLLSETVLRAASLRSQAL